MHLAVLRFARMTALSVGILWPGVAEGQSSVEPDLTPIELAEEFQLSVQRLGWEAAAFRMDPVGLAAIKERVTFVVEADTLGTNLELLFDNISLEEYHALDPAEVFVTLMELFETELPGLLNAWSARDFEFLGEIRETPDLSHPVYRNTEMMQGANPELRIMTLVRTNNGWRVRTSPELEAIPEALRGLIRFLRRQ